MKNKVEENNQLFQKALKARQGHQVAWDQIKQVTSEILHEVQANSQRSGYFTSNQANTMKTNCRINEIIARLISTLHSFLAPDNEVFFSIRSRYTRSNETKRWFDEASGVYFDLVSNASSNFHSILNLCIKDLVRFGNCSAKADLIRDKDSARDFGRLLFTQLPLERTYINVDNNNEINSIFSVVPDREADSTIHNTTLSVFSMEKLRDSLWETFQYRSEGSFHLEEGQQDYLKSVGGVQDSPVKKAECNYQKIVFGRLNILPMQIYGAGMVLQCLGDIKNYYEDFEMLRAAGHFNLDPVSIVPDGGFARISKLKAGMVIKKKEGYPETISLLQNSIEHNTHTMILQTTLEAIERALLYDTTQVPEKTNMTAMEISQRAELRTQTLLPLVARIQKEFLSPLLVAGFWEIYNYSKEKNFEDTYFKAPPEDIEHIDIALSSRFMLHRKLASVNTNRMFLEDIVRIAQINPAILAEISLERIIIKMQEAYNLSPEVLSTPEEKEAMLQQMAQMQQAQMQQGQRSQHENQGEEGGQL